ncbi:MAG: hypothetical protein V4523_14380 [Pseudomonadota bacterium]
MRSLYFSGEVRGLRGPGLSIQQAADVADAIALATDLKPAVEDATAALAGNRLRRAPSFGYFGGSPVVRIETDANGRVTEMQTKAALYVRGVLTADSRMGRTTAPTYGYFEGSPVLSVELDANNRVIGMQTKAASYVRGQRIARVDNAPAYTNGAGSLAVDLSGVICYILLITGQSLGEGNSTPVQPILSTTPVWPGYALMLEPAVRLRTRVGLASPPPPTTPIGTQLIDLVEAADAETYVWETSASSWANHLIQEVVDNTGRKIRVAPMVSCFGGAAYRDVKRGTSTYGWTMRGLEDLSNAIRARGWTPVVLAFDFIQNETDTSQDTDSAQYGAGMKQHRRNLAADIKRITLQSDEPLGILDSPQMPDPDGPFEHNTALGQQYAADDPYIILGPPYYHLPRAIGEEVHLSSLGEYRRGPALTRVVMEACFGAGHAPLMPKRCYMIGNTKFAMEFPRPVLIDDDPADEATRDVKAAGLPNYRGVRFNDGTANIDIVDHEGDGTKVLTFTLSSPANVGRRRVAYALERNSIDETRDGPVYGARGLIRAVDGAILSLADGPDAGHLNHEWARAFILDL